MEKSHYINYKGPFAIVPVKTKQNPKLKSVKPSDNKLMDSIESAIKKSGLKDGDTISFHHHFREGDYVLNKVVEEISKLGIKNLTLAASSLLDVHDELIEHIKSGVISKISTSGLRGKLGEWISAGNMDEPVIIRSHGGRARAIECGDIKIDVAFIGSPSSDDYGNLRGGGKNATFGSMGYGMVDANYAQVVIALTDDLVSYPNYPASIDQTKVDMVVKIAEVGDSKGIASGATRFTKSPKELVIAENAANFIIESEYFKNGFSFQTGSGGSSLAVTRFLKETMIEKNIKASFALGGITMPMIDLFEQGFIEHLFDVQTFDLTSCESLFKNKNHHEIDASMYANPHNGGCFVNKLDIVILSALEIDINFNVNVITGSNGVIRGASGGHSDTSAGAKLTVVVAPLIRGRIPTVVDQVNTIVTPGETVDVFVSDRGISINPKRTDLIEHFKNSRLPIVNMETLYEKAIDFVGVPRTIDFGAKIVAIVEYRDGSVIDVIRNI